jgi:hypothetical protein
MLSLGCLPAAAAFLPRRACSVASVEIVPEPHPLSEESARGYDKLLGAAQVSAPLIILPATRQLSFEGAERFRQQVRRGWWLLVESGAAYSRPGELRTQGQVLYKVFGLNIAEAIGVSTREATYLTYNCPERTVVRTFGAVTPIDCSPAEKLAEYAGVPVAARRWVGRGGVVYLGSMLGVGLLAQEREALAVGAALLRAETDGALKRG